MAASNANRPAPRATREVARWDRVGMAATAVAGMMSVSSATAFQRPLVLHRVEREGHGDRRALERVVRRARRPRDLELVALARAAGQVADQGERARPEVLDQVVVKVGPGLVAGGVER